MPRRTYAPRHGRPRPQGQRSDWQWLIEVLASERRYSPRNPQTPGGEQRRRTSQENTR